MSKSIKEIMEENAYSIPHAISDQELVEIERKHKLFRKNSICLLKMISKHLYEIQNDALRSICKSLIEIRFDLKQISEKQLRYFLRGIVDGEFDFIFDKNMVSFISDVKNGMYDDVIEDFIDTWPMSENEIQKMKLDEAKMFLNGSLHIDFLTDQDKINYRNWAENFVTGDGIL